MLSRAYIEMRVVNSSAARETLCDLHKTHAKEFDLQIDSRYAELIEYAWPSTGETRGFRRPQARVNPVSIKLPRSETEKAQRVETNR